MYNKYYLLLFFCYLNLSASENPLPIEHQETTVTTQSQVFPDRTYEHDWWEIRRWIALKNFTTKNREQAARCAYGAPCFGCIPLTLGALGLGCAKGCFHTCPIKYQKGESRLGSTSCCCAPATDMCDVGTECCMTVGVFVCFGN